MAVGIRQSRAGRSLGLAGNPNKGNIEEARVRAWRRSIDVRILMTRNVADRSDPFVGLFDSSCTTCVDPEYRHVCGTLFQWHHILERD